MSHTYYNELWLVTRKDLEKLLELEQKLQEHPLTREKAILNAMLSMYIRYQSLVRRLITCYDQMVQTQKRELVKRILDCAIGRMLEYKKQIVNTSFTDYQWPGNVLEELKFTPDDIELFASASGRERLKERKEFIEELEEARRRPKVRERTLSQMELEAALELQKEQEKEKTRRRRVRPEPSLPVVIESPEEKAAREAKLAAEMAFLNAILLIQSHERARVGRREGAEVQRAYDYKKKLLLGEIEPRKIDEAEYAKAAITIQNAWRRYAAKKAMKKQIAHLEGILHMTIPSWQSRETFVKEKENFQQKRALIPLYEASTNQVTNNERARLMRIKGPGLMEDITDEIHEWFAVWYDVTGEYDVFPAAELGGSVMIVTGQTLTPEEYLIQKREMEKKAKLPKKPEEKEKKKPKKVRKLPETLPCLIEGNADFIKNWSFRDDKDNPEQKEYLDMITEKLCYELQLEIREIVDDLMRVELKLLNRALLKDKDKKPKKEKAKKKKAKRKRKKVEVPIEDLFSELLEAEIIRNYPNTYLRDWIGDLSYANYEISDISPDHKHRIGEVKQLVLEYCVLPLTSKETHQLAPLVRSVCIYGLPQSGKNFLANAIFSEVGALLFDVSAPVLLNKYVGKANEKKLISSINKVARFYAPSIIFLDGGERPWLKKVPADERYLQPKRFARHFARLVKGIKAGDQILFLSVSDEPQKASRKLIKIYDKFIMVPITDYNTLYMFYKNLLMKYLNIDRDIDVSCLAMVSVGIPLSFIQQAVEKVLSVRRRITLKRNPLNPMEIMDEIITYQYPTTKIMNAFVKFQNRLPLVRKRAKALAVKKKP